MSRARIWFRVYWPLALAAALAAVAGSVFGYHSFGLLFLALALVGVPLIARHVNKHEHLIERPGQGRLFDEAWRRA